MSSLLMLWCLLGATLYHHRVRGQAVQVTEANLHEMLTPTEWITFFGTSKNVRSFSLVRPRLPDISWTERRRKRRSSELVVLEATGLKRRFELELKPSPPLLDPKFVVLNRWKNYSEMLPSDIAEQKCYFQSDGEQRAAVALCGGMRGIIESTDDEYYTINPLPQRFHDGIGIPHVVVKWKPEYGDTTHIRRYRRRTREGADYFDTGGSGDYCGNKRVSVNNDNKSKDFKLFSNVNYNVLPHTGDNKEDNLNDLRIFPKTRDRSLNLINNDVNNVNKSVDKFHISKHSKIFNTKLLTSAIKLSEGILDSGNKIKSSIPTKRISEVSKDFLLQRRKRRRRSTATSLPPPRSPIYIETAVFIDKDLYQHMSINFPTNTERELVRVVLAMINAVQLLYHDPSLGRPVNFVLKRVEILHADPASLQRPHDIDRFLSSFCTWQRGENPTADSDPLHWDHALILTGLDLYVVSKNGKVSSQVVGLAPVAGMCTATSSCTVNEGRHFESVYVVAHEIGHNLGMRHDGPLAGNECDPGSFIMSPTLGSGKITWSSCSRRYLEMFLETPQAQCMLDKGDSPTHLDHNDGVLPGERFNADQQCMLKYGRGSIHAVQQPLNDICRDLHCQRDRYTWTSHPALEGTACGTQKWCRSGRCISQGLSALQAGFAPNSRIDGAWSDWSPFSECASGCLFSDDGRLKTGSTGIMISTRRCNNPRPENGGLPCQGSDRKFQTCDADQCGNVPHTTIRDFADKICIRARETDIELLGTGLQRISSDAVEACTVWCYKKNGGSKSRGWTFPDGTACQSRRSRYGKPTYCISGRCEEFICDRYDDATFSIAPDLCTTNAGRLFGRTKGQRRDIKESQTTWSSASGCHFNCLVPASGLRVVVAKDRKCRLQDGKCEGENFTSVQLCQPDQLACGRLKTPFEHASFVCNKYKERVRRLSGLGMQISPAVEDPDRPCRVACQDEEVTHRFYLVNGEDGWFPFGTDCSRGVPNKKAYCISGKCLEFGADDTPLYKSEYVLPLVNRLKRSLYPNSTRIVSILDQITLDQIISTVNVTGPRRSWIGSESFTIDLDHPVHEEIDVGYDSSENETL